MLENLNEDYAGCLIRQSKHLIIENLICSYFTLHFNHVWKKNIEKKQVYKTVFKTLFKTPNVFFANPGATYGRQKKKNCCVRKRKKNWVKSCSAKAIKWSYERVKMPAGQFHRAKHMRVNRAFLVRSWQNSAITNEF